MAVYLKKYWHLILFLVQAQHSILSAVAYWGLYLIKTDHPLFHHPSPLHLSLSLTSFRVLHSIFRVKNVKCCPNVSTLTACPVRHLLHNGMKNRALYNLSLSLHIIYVMSYNLNVSLFDLVVVIDLL